MGKKIQDLDSCTAAKCSICNSKEGEFKPMGIRTVKLSKVDIFGTDKMICQYCKSVFKNAIKDRRKAQKEVYQDKGLMNLKKFIQLIS